MNLQKKIIVVGLIWVMAIIGGCTMAKISGRGPIPLILNQPQARVEVIKQIKYSKHIMFDYTKAFDVSEVLSDILAGTDADAIINLTVTVKSTPVDFLMNFITLGIAQSTTFEISGQAVKVPSGLGSISIPGSQTLAESENLADLLPLVVQNSQYENSSTMIVRIHRGENETSYKLIKYNLNKGLSN